MEQIYLDYGLPSASVFKKILKQEGINATAKQIKEFIEKQDEQQTHKRVVKSKNPKPITASGKAVNYQADLLDFQKYKGNNDGYAWLLIGIDVLTRKAGAVAIKRKTKEETAEAIDLLYKQISGTPILTTTDNGGEFNEVADKNTMHKTADVGDHNVLGMIDNFSLRIKSKIAKLIKRNNNTRWIDSIDSIVKNYNKTPHSSLDDNTPNEMEKYPWLARQYALNRFNKYQQKEAKKKQIKVGDFVRILEKKHKLSKGTDQTYSSEVYKVKEKDGQYYVLSDGDKYRKPFLLVVPKDEVDMVKKRNVVKEATKARKDKNQLNREDIREENIKRKTRDWKPTKRALEAIAR